MDNFVGTAGGDTFLARTRNSVNTFNDGDMLDGGAGIDVVYLDFVSVGNAITPNLKNIESVVVRAQSAGTDANGVGTTKLNGAVEGTDGNNMPQDRTVQIDAQRSLATNEANKVIADIGVTNWESSNSRSDVVIEDVRIGNTQKTKDITITFRESDPGNVDFGVYFDQHSLRNTGTGTTAINILLMDTAAAAATATAVTPTPLLNNNFNSYTFFVDNVKVVLGGAGTAAGTAIDEATTYPALLAAFQLALKTANVAGVVTDLSGGVTATLSGLVNMSTEANKATESAEVASSFLNLTGQVLTLTSAGTSAIASKSVAGEAGGWAASGPAPSTGAIVQTFNTGTTSTTELVTSKIVLDDVGRGSTGGDLVVGGLSVGETSTSRGVERFEITVQDSSKLQTINGTNNALREVTIVNGTTSNASSAYNAVVTDKGNLTVNGSVGNDAALPGVEPGATTAGNPSSVGVHDGNYGFTDVRLIDASAMTGQLAFTAQITTDSLKKYVNLADTQNVPTADVAGSGNINFNVKGANFLYTGGGNNDTMSVAMDSTTLASTTMTGQSDFTIVIDGGAGNDVITTNILEVGSGGTPWYTDQKQNANIRIEGGEGNDTIWTQGAGDVIINAGAGNDTVYTDNTGAASTTNGISPKAVLVINATPVAALLTSTADIQTAGAGVKGFLYGGKLTVTASGASTAGGGVTIGAAVAGANGFESTVDIPTGANGVVTQFYLNQAIKAAINDNAVMNKLLVATDGPANTLVITSKIDGTFADSDMIVSVAAKDLTTLTPSEQAIALAAFKLASQNSAADILAAQAANVLTIDGATVGPETTGAKGANDLNGMRDAASAGGFATGAASTVESDNTINLGAGNDVLVLGTGANSNDKIVFTGYGLGNDTIVNFDDAAGTGLDTVNFKSYQVGKASLSGDVADQTTIVTAVVVGSNTSVAANSVTVLTGAFTTTNTFAGLTEAKLLAAVNSTNTIGGADYAGLTAITLDALTTYQASGAGTTLAGGTGHAIVLVENNLNLGEYAVFDLTFNGLATNTTKDFSAATLIGTFDFGSTVDFTVAGVVA